MQRKVTFKSSYATGKAHVGNPYPYIVGKVKGKVFAQIVCSDTTNYRTPWTVGVRVADRTTWRWLTFKARFADADLAKAWLQVNVDEIYEKYVIVPEE